MIRHRDLWRAQFQQTPVNVSFQAVLLQNPQPSSVPQVTTVSLASMPMGWNMFRRDTFGKKCESCYGHGPSSGKRYIPDLSA